MFSEGQKLEAVKLFKKTGSLAVKNGQEDNKKTRVLLKALKQENIKISSKKVWRFSYLYGLDY